MTADAGMAFAQLFSQRRRELDLSVVDVAVRTGLPIEVVVGWDQGRSVPDGDDLDKVSDFLKLPKPLLKEALRRVADHRLDASGADLSRPPEPTEDTFEALIDAPYPSTSVSERLRQLPDMAQRSFAGLFNDIRRFWSRKRRMARAPTAYPSYTEDRDQLLTYRLRVVFTAAGIAVLALVLRWSLGGLGTAIADLWNALTGAL
ncbi:MAG: helix-turn-helix transcriptional regulator [bacterium]|nr:helix-turn-helix transcriptional regulator [bacterium]MDE0286985.1 helix-turn-helix transcriptional regulator [bacterium]MDE0437352.1 helix-turn-helix transcriptional regulator [bacterium]